MQIISTLIITIGFVFMAFGVTAMFRFKNFYTRILASSKIDTVGIITVIIGLGIRHGLSPFTAKIVLLGIILVIFNPLVAHILVRSAYRSGHKIEFFNDNEADNT